MTPSISIIVPVFNSEKYLCRCVDSILSQTLKDFEVLLIDDGSTDKSGEICDIYALKDNRVRVFHKENGGVASARQMGLDYAMGEYSIHADADDWIEKNELEEMYAYAIRNDADIVIADFFNDYADGSTNIRKMNLKNMESNYILSQILRDDCFGSLWHKLVRHSVYYRYGVNFIQGVNYCEDVLLLAQLLQHNLKIVYLPQAYYHYCMNNNASITRHYTIDTFIMRQRYIQELKRILPCKYNDDIDFAAFLVKSEAHRNGYLRYRDYNNCPQYMRTSIKSVLSSNHSKQEQRNIILSVILARFFKNQNLRK